MIPKNKAEFIQGLRDIIYDTDLDINLRDAAARIDIYLTDPLLYVHILQDEVNDPDD